MSLEEDYKLELNRRYWQYQKDFFHDKKDYFERPFAPDGRPPVFHKKTEENNVIIKPDATQDEINRLFNLVKKKHKWFRSMNSSQALAQSILGNLAIYNKLELLTKLTDDEGSSLFGRGQVSSENFIMEYEVTHLGERRGRRTSLDGFIDGQYQVAIECKLTENEVGPCSRPRKLINNSEYCNGNYMKQNMRNKRCQLTEIGVKYWQFIPELFKWNADIDLSPCPVNHNYQLVRNILAVCVRDGYVSPKNGHMILLYDDRNPAFRNGGKGYVSIKEIKNALYVPELLKTCSWQRIILVLRENNELQWLTEHLNLKYGL